MVAKGGRIGAAVVMALLSAGCGGESDDGPASAAVQTTSSVGSVPEPTAEQKRPYLAIASQIDPGLGRDEERAMDHANRICKGIMGGPTYGSSLLEFARAELSGSREISLAETEQAIKAIKLWCH
ncbi:hypothetical protein GCM10009527_090100 [Actinomadura nitritigenes]|uniref:DUF732 domain-containing protein n=1 Tax=Actinomadura nitritigenes TaxID=134602 RepID=A0ABS3RDR8_9ACTN|nr:hypothetical protein [Actinomadura nitritigenes]MBO2444363.1 hypothetical protein [Actinomadura nitritigenes]